MHTPTFAKDLRGGIEGARADEGYAIVDLGDGWYRWIFYGSHLDAVVIEDTGEPVAGLGATIRAAADDWDHNGSGLGYLTKLRRAATIQEKKDMANPEPAREGGPVDPVSRVRAFVTAKREQLTDEADAVRRHDVLMIFNDHQLTLSDLEALLERARSKG